MKAIKCEMCDSSDVVKQGDFFVCQSCGVKYEPEAAKRLVVEIDDSSKLNNLYILARRAREEGNTADAMRYYDEIIKSYPDDWEAYFFTSYYRADNMPDTSIGRAASSLSKSLLTSYSMLVKTDIGEDEKCAAAKEIARCSESFASTKIGQAKNRHNRYIESLRDSINAGMTSKDLEKALQASSAMYRSDVLECLTVFDSVGQGVEIYFPDNADMHPIAEAAWKQGIDAHPKNTACAGIIDANEWKQKIRKYDSAYVMPNIDPAPSRGKGGCYIATAVYGSYDCPEVWTLRRYRDYGLASTFPGRAFVRAYYAISPTVVKLFGHNVWFKRLWRKLLDGKVRTLNSKGYSDDPYSDEVW